LRFENVGSRRPLALLVGLALAALAASPARAAADGFALVCNAKAATSSLSKADVRAIFTGKAKTFAGNAVVVVVRGEDDVPFGKFVDQVFGIPTPALLSKIKQEVFKGEMTKPVKAASDDEVVQAVTNSPGVIGVVSADAVGHLPKTVTVVTIGG
jgi:ABC-type phosphate transport system substrate-binding protein